MNLHPTPITDQIITLRTELYRSLTAPIDAMWELLYIASSQHYLIESQGETIGYCCIDEKDCLLQMHVHPAHVYKMDQIIGSMIHTKSIRSASLSSSDPLSFNACLLHCSSIEPNTFCFQHPNVPHQLDPGISVDLVTEADIPSIKTFLREQVNMDDTFGYTENLVNRKEIFMLKEGDTILATSECRMSDTQPEIADLGIIVNKTFRGRGLATQIMQLQANRVLAASRQPICSTTVDNIASRKVIEKSGFYCSNIIFDIHFTHHHT